VRSGGGQLCSPACKAFGWTNAVIPTAVNPSDIVDVITTFNTQAERLKHIRKANTVNSLLMNDWVYRWEKILKTVG
jgi:hypothetical protein